MHLPSILSTFAFVCGCHALGVSTGTTTLNSCTTKIAKSSLKSVPTSSATTTVTLWPKILFTTTQPYKTVTPSAVTTTTTFTSTATDFFTASTITDIFSTTSTDFETETSTILTTSTSTLLFSTTVTSTSTSTIAAPSNFLPVSDTLYSTTQLARRALEARATQGAGCLAGKPNAVNCKKIVQVQPTKSIIYTLRPKTTTLPPKTQTASTTVTTTSTSTIVPDDVSTTLSFSTTSTLIISVTSTVSETTSTTITNSVVATSTAYAACSADNMYSGDIDNAYNNGNGAATGASVFDFINTASAQDCCAACLNAAGCEGTVYTSGQCLLLHNSGSTCPSQTAQGQSILVGVGSDVFTISNGYCGYFFGHP